ncbi:MAG: sodium:proton antiporter [Gammaproteobacteria bacterium]|nr:sodium:proton antiporter [Gammaproteobacteria bacterium]NNL44314.1 sodium:proton antiporter [Woeseiaceae bacterium]
MHSSSLIILSGVLVAGFACQWIAWRVKLPSILFLLLTGIIAGPVLGWLRPNELFGELLEPFVSLAVAVILYEGSMTLKLAEIRGHGNVVRNLVTFGVLITWFVATLTARVFLGWDIYLAALFGAIVTVSGPTVILPLLRTVRPTKALSNILRWEGILVDPLGAILAVLVFNFIVVTQTAATTGQLFFTLGLIIVVGAGLGVLVGHLLGVVLKNHWLPDFLRDYAALAMVILVFTLAEAVESESGLLAVTVMGVWQANMKDLDLEDILDFKESLTLVLVAGLFIILAARVQLENIVGLGVGAIAVLLALQFVAGPLRALVCSIGSELSGPERAYLGWIFPRGIVAAAVSALFALRLERMGYPGAENLVPIVFTIIVGTVVIQSLSGSVVAHWLKVASPDPKGVLVVGSNRLALLYATAMHDAGQRVLVASMNWEGVRLARMAGLPVFYGSPVSTYAERHMDLTGIGQLLAMSDRPGLNELACVSYRYEFGRESVYTFKQDSEAGHEKHHISGEAAGRVLFGGQKSMEDLLALIPDPAQTRTTEITETFSFADYRSKYPERLLLFIKTPGGHVRFPLGDEDMKVPAGSSVTALILGEEQQPADSATGS